MGMHPRQFKKFEDVLTPEMVTSLGICLGASTVSVVQIVSRTNPTSKEIDPYRILAYKKAVEKYGHKRLYRQYLIENGPQFDAHADGSVDFDFDDIPGNEGAEDELTPLQAYAQRSFSYLIDWVEKGIRIC